MTCFMIKDNSPKATICYVHLPQDQQHIDFARNFVNSYVAHPPGLTHETLVICNGAPPNDTTRQLFAPLQGLKFIQHDDSGWDIGAYQVGAKHCKTDVIVFFGGSTYLKADGWLAYMVNAIHKHGMGLYGCMGNKGDTRFNVYPHLRTTGFWTHPTLFNLYPIKVTRHEQRYEFEHGKTSLSEWVKGRGLPIYVVATNGEYLYDQWDDVPNGYHRGDQSAMLCGDRLTAPPYYHIA